MSAAPASLKADAVLLGVTALWGVTFVTVKDALPHADPFTFLALRFSVGALAATGVAHRLRALSLDRDTLRAGLWLALFLFSGYAFQTAGLEHTTPSRSAFITGLSVVLVPFAALVLFRRWPGLPALAGVVLSVGGLHLLTGGGAAEAGSRLGDLLTLGCAATFAFHIVLTAKLAPGRSAPALVTIQLWVTALLSAVCVPFVEVRLEWTYGFVGAVLFCGVFASALAIIVQTWAQARTSAVRAGLIISLEPVFAASLSVGLGRERLGARELFGGALMVLGVLTAEAGAVLWERLRRDRAAQRMA